MITEGQPGFDEAEAARHEAAEAQEWPPVWRAVGYALRVAWWVVLLFTP